MTRMFRTSAPRLALVVNVVANALVVVVGSGCGPNPFEVDELTTKLRDECHVAPQMPLCCFQDEDCSNFAYARFLNGEGGSESTRQCIRDAECGTLEDSQALADCVAADEHAVHVDDEACGDACADALADCGGGDSNSCDIATAEACYADFDACRDAC